MNLGRAYLSESNYKEAENWFRLALKTLETPGNFVDVSTEDRIDARKRIVDTIQASAGSGGAPRKTSIELLLNEICDIGYDAGDLNEQEYALVELIGLHRFYGLHNQVNVDRARLKRVKSLMPATDSKSDESDDVLFT